MLHELLNTALGPFKVKIWLAIVAGLAMIAFAAIKIADNRDKRMIETAQESGAVKAQSEGKSTTLKQNKDANDAGNKVRDNRDGALYAECLRSSTDATRANCEQFRN